MALNCSGVISCLDTSTYIIASESTTEIDIICSEVAACARSNVFITATHSPVTVNLECSDELACYEMKVHFLTYSSLSVNYDCQDRNSSCEDLHHVLGSGTLDHCGCTGVQCCTASLPGCSLPGACSVPTAFPSSRNPTSSVVRKHLFSLFLDTHKCIIFNRLTKRPSLRRTQRRTHL